MIIAVWLGCSTQSTPPSDSAPEGMTFVAAKGKQTLLGSDAVYAKKDEETPRLTAVFTYDFFMDKTEVTQSNYNGLMGRNPATSNFGLGTDYPIYNVTWYDAVLYCNARSKNKGMDTVYEYSGQVRDASGKTSSLSSLTVHFERAGYRLPTEAEWEFAARGGTQTSFVWGDSLDSSKAGRTAWYGGNATGKTHAVSQLSPNANGLYDVAGNVMEWVNDWKGPYAALTVMDFLGSREPGLIAERAVKGGAFSYDMRYLRFSGRSANYPSLSSAATEYIGFRCVLGAIINGRYLSGGQAHSATPIVTPSLSGVLRLFGHNHVKLVFVNATSSTRTLCYIDFSESPVTVHEYLDDSTVFTPVISPDGQWVAYANADEGDSRTGTVKVRKLAVGSVAKTIPGASAVIPRWWVNPGTTDTFLVYATNARDNTDPAWSADQTYRVRISGGVASGVPSLVASGGYHDGFSNDGKYLITGYRRLHIRNIAGARDRILFTGPANGKANGDTSQVCNVSIHPNFATLPQMLLLDFGYTGTSSVVGRPYGLHEILFRLDTSGNVAGWYGAPQGFVAWQDVEWSNHPDYAVAVGEDESQGYPAVVGTYLKNSTTATLAGGATLRQPGLWVQPGASIPSSNDPGVLDSMGQYNEPQKGEEQLEFASRMKLLWGGARNSAEVVCLGSSHFTNGIWPPSFSHFKALNTGYAAGGLLGMNKLMTHYVLPNFQKLRAVVLEVHPGYYNLENGDATWLPNMEQTKGYQYDSAHGFWNNGVPHALDSIMRQYNEGFSPIEDSLGTIYIGPPTTPWDTTSPTMITQKPWIANDTTLTQTVNLLGNMVQVLRSQKVYAVLIITPQSHIYKNAPYYGKFGPPWAIARDLVPKIQNLCTGNPYCIFYDADQYGNHDFPDSLFFNSDHLVNSGAKQLSHRIDSLLYKVTGPTP